MVTLWASDADAGAFQDATRGHGIPGRPRARARAESRHPAPYPLHTWTDMDLAELKVTRYEVRDRMAT